MTLKQTIDMTEIRHHSYYAQLAINRYLPPEVICANVARIICKHYRLTIDELKERSRKPRIVQPRQKAMYLMCLKGVTCVDIAKFFKCDHTTIIYSRNLVRDYMSVYPEFEREMRLLQSSIY